MKSLNIEEVIKAVDGVINQNIDTSNIYIKNICTDSRKAKNGDLFIPLKGENFDGHCFLKEAFEKGVTCSLSEEDIPTKGILIKVKDTKKALAKLAYYYRNLFNVKVVAVTGSTGKTTTKDMIYSVLSQKFNTVKTEGNFNNEIGLPLTIFRIEQDTEVVVLEMGMNHFGEIHNLSYIARPDIGIITNIGTSHIENLGSKEGILRAKYEIFDFLKENGLKIFNADDDMLFSLKDKSNISTKFYSLNKNLDAYATNIIKDGLNGISANIHYKNKEINIKLKTPGVHMVSNALCATLVGDYLEIDGDSIKKGLENFLPSKMRMDIIKTDYYTIINDVYNASPSSMEASIDVLSNAKGRKVAILGDMFELGEYAKELHEKLGRYITQKNIDVLICIGELSKYIEIAAIKNKSQINSNLQNIFHFNTQEEFFNNIQNIIKKGDNILVKASRGMEMEKTVDKLKR